VRTERRRHSEIHARRCRGHGLPVVYAVVPEKRIEDLIAAQARKKALALVGTASTHMALENQALPAGKIAREAERLSRELAREMPTDFWSDK